MKRRMQYFSLEYRDTKVSRETPIRALTRSIHGQPPPSAWKRLTAAPSLSLTKRVQEPLASATRCQLDTGQQLTASGIELRACLIDTRGRDGEIHIVSQPSKGLHSTVRPGQPFLEEAQ